MTEQATTVQLPPPERVNQTNDIGELAKALVKAQNELANPAKNKTAKITSQKGASFSYSYADLATVCDTIRPVFAKHGLTFMHLSEERVSDGKWRLICRLLHESGQYIDSVFQLPVNAPAQELGSWLTYMRRYSTACMAFVSAETDDDGYDAARRENADIEAEKRIEERRQVRLAELQKEGKSEAKIRVVKDMRTEPKKEEETVKNVTEPEKKPSASEEDKPEGNLGSSEQRSDDLKDIAESLRAVMVRDSVSRAELAAVCKKFKGDMPPEQYDETFVSRITTEDNWKKIVAKVHEARKG